MSPITTSERTTTHPPILDEIQIDDIEVLEQLASPLRLRILFHLRQPRSVRELAERMGMPVTRLYYHVGILEEAGAIGVVETRKRGPQLERVYRIVAHSLRPAPDIVTSGRVDAQRFAEAAASLIIDSARAELTESLTAHAAAGFDPTSIRGSLGRTIVSIPPDRAGEVIERLEAFIAELKDEEDPDDGQAFGFTYTFFAMEPTTPGADA